MTKLTVLISLNYFHSVREKQFANEKLSNERSGKIVSVSFSTSTS